MENRLETMEIKKQLEIKLTNQKATYMSSDNDFPYDQQ